MRGSLDTCLYRVGVASRVVLRALPGSCCFQLEGPYVSYYGLRKLSNVYIRPLAIVMPRNRQRCYNSI